DAARTPFVVLGQGQPEDARFQTLRDKFAGALMITSKGRLHNHPGWHVLGILSGDDFNPPAFGDQYLLQTGFAGRCKTDRSTQPGLNVGTPQIYPGINNRGAAFDMTDYYPEMWEQLNSLSPAKD
ncbi:MAG TPA: hypothetical protein PLO23_06375, partial [Alphaproteobacteria bacterium]|nr:hypothetical protein [Alphaproteobacteria bacterium]